MSANNRSRYLAGVLKCFVSICAASIQLQSHAGSGQVPEGFPEAHYRQAKESGSKILLVDSARSIVIIEVRRAGPVSWLGHDHVVVSRDLSGYISLEEGLADLFIPLEKLVMDEAEIRIETGYKTQLSKKDIEATFLNMQNKTLESGRFPFALIHVIRASANRPEMNMSISLHGITRTYEVRANIEKVSNGVSVDGRMSLKQTDFGISPISVLGGAIQVQDKLDLRFHILAQNY